MREIKPRTDLVGKRFGKLIVTKRADWYIQENGKRIAQWYCNCDCGTKDYIVRQGNLKSGHTQSCGCIGNNPESHLIDLTGQRFGSLIVMYRIDNRTTSNGKSRVEWHCKCDCGNECNVLGNYLRNGDTKSCGCLNHLGYKKYNKYDLSNEFGIGWTSNTNKEFYFDLEDYDKIKNYTWYENDNNYIVTDVNNKKIRLHRLVMDVINKDYIVDHIHGSETKNDNRKNNLRLCTISQNLMNRKKASNNTSGVSGVNWFKPANMWQASIGINNKSISLGYYKNFDDAVIARKEAEEKYFGEFSYDNSQNRSV